MQATRSSGVLRMVQVFSLETEQVAGSSKAREVSRAGSRQQGSYLPAPFSPGRGLKASSPPPILIHPKDK